MMELGASRFRYSVYHLWVHYSVCHLWVHFKSPIPEPFLVYYMGEMMNFYAS